MRIEATGAVASTTVGLLTEADHALFATAEDHDGTPAISDGLLAIASGEDTAHKAQTASSIWRVYSDEAADLIGFGIRALQGDRHAAEFVIAPEHRGKGLGEAVLTAILTEQPAAWTWSHGDHPAAAALAARHGLHRARVLYQMRTATGLRLDDLPRTAPPEGVTIRSFTSGDEDGWLRVNNAAFDWHPEQGHQTRTDIDAIVTAPDFDPDTVILATRATSGSASTEEIIGFHQTKITEDEPPVTTTRLQAADAQTVDRLGEVYVVGVDPSAHTGGIGKALTVEGMRRMVGSGAQAIELYVESDNAPALGLYRRLGFEVAVAHVSYAPPAHELD